MINVESKLLIVDDLPGNLLALDALIRGPGRSVFQAGSADEALALMLEHEFALAILDVQMPVMNGFELAELMRGTERTRHIPIIFVSAAGREMNYAFQGYESGAVDFLQKPLDAYVVTSKVNVFVDLHRHRKALKREMEALAASHRDDFMSMVSHELRTPLNTLYLETQVRKMHLAKGNLKPFTAEQLPTLIERDQRQIQNMVRLIDDMLDVTRLRRDALSIRPKPFDLSALARRVIDNLAQQADAAGSHITLDAPFEVPGVWDEFRIEQVLTNLLTNALRYGGGKPVKVEVAQNEGLATMSVRDRGIGVAEADQARIFEQFERTDDSRKHAAGLGLGLYITREIVRAHGGTIALESVAGEGSLFEVTLPLLVQAPSSS